ncbi:serine protease snake-like [Leptidea sinapis]|uniref:serine protease snake-like n=1 Tax=Leptidea sinapis TaxID=189913 RepID=UPI002140EF6A|nr:serine protease snake-like [Leptidea sinapis]
MAVISNYILPLMLIQATIDASYSRDFKKPMIKTSTNDETKATNSTSDPFSSYDLPKPHFYRSDRRISEIKCLEYISQLQKKDGIDVRFLDCDQKAIEIFRIATIGGRITEAGEFPHMGALGWRAVNNGTWIFKCGSTLISENYLLTAAHCSQVAASDKAVADIRPEIVRLGSKNILDPSPNERFIDKKIKRIIKHPTYMSPKKYFDIAIIEISEKVQFTKYIQPACLWSDFDTTRLGKQATVTGWGITEFRNEAKISVELQAADVDIIDSNTCDRLLQCNRNWCGLKPHQICAGDLTGHVDTCQGDSGGPLQVKIPCLTTSETSMHYIIGVISFGYKCARPNQPSIYTRVSSFVEWIEGIVWRGLR